MRKFRTCSNAISDSNFACQLTEQTVLLMVRGVLLGTYAQIIKPNLLVILREQMESASTLQIFADYENAKMPQISILSGI